MKKVKEKLFVVRKYIYARSAHEALKRERKHRPDDVWVDEEWKRANQDKLESCIGFEIPNTYEE